jgi:hypothetical protein
LFNTLGLVWLMKKPMKDWLGLAMAMQHQVLVDDSGRTDSTMNISGNFAKVLLRNIWFLDSKFLGSKHYCAMSLDLA